MAHPHPSRRHIMVCYRRFILGQKKKFSSEEKPEPGERIPRRGARGIAHFKDYILEYLKAKRDVIGGSL